MESLLRRARQGDREAYDALLSGLADRLLLYVEVRLGALRNRLDPCDVLQETLLMAHRSFAGFQGDSLPAFRGWLFAIADHRLHDLADHHATQKRHTPGGEVPLSGVVEQLRATRTGPATAAEREERRVRLHEALQGLEQAEREAILLHHFHGLTQDEVAERLGVSTKQVRGLLVRARYRLGSALEE